MLRAVSHCLFLWFRTITRAVSSSADWNVHARKYVAESFFNDIATPSVLVLQRLTPRKQQH